MQNQNQKRRLLQPAEMARKLRVSPGWLRIEAKAGRLPHLNAGGTLLFDPDVVERALSERARQGVAPDRGGKP